MSVYTHKHIPFIIYVTHTYIYIYVHFENFLSNTLNSAKTQQFSVDISPAEITLTCYRVSTNQRYGGKNRKYD